ncbi:hypothetical protein EYF80_020995 [Liparis tanakae]|uniref:Uncharacterized protein n=1 Tax=Liparis tanakae TaxID=230148 RepID=A0A4Z2HSW9_9TELE|nr:hypothetical protein EYF80_020995 [Liparis tanakae]
MKRPSIQTRKKAGSGPSVSRSMERTPLSTHTSRETPTLPPLFTSTPLGAMKIPLPTTVPTMKHMAGSRPIPWDILGLQGRSHLGNSLRGLTPAPGDVGARLPDSPTVFHLTSQDPWSTQVEAKPASTPSPEAAPPLGPRHRDQRECALTFPPEPFTGQPALTSEDPIRAVCSDELFNLNISESKLTTLRHVAAGMSASSGVLCTNKAEKTRHSASTGTDAPVSRRTVTPDVTPGGLSQPGRSVMNLSPGL